MCVSPWVWTVRCAWTVRCVCLLSLGREMCMSTWVWSLRCVSTEFGPWDVCVYLSLDCEMCMSTWVWTVRCVCLPEFKLWDVCVYLSLEAEMCVSTWVWRLRCPVPGASGGARPPYSAYGWQWQWPGKGSWNQTAFREGIMWVRWWIKNELPVNMHKQNLYDRWNVKSVYTTTLNGWRTLL